MYIYVYVCMSVYIYTIYMYVYIYTIYIIHMYYDIKVEISTLIILKLDKMFPKHNFSFFLNA